MIESWFPSPVNTEAHQNTSSRRSRTRLCNRLLGTIFPNYTKQDRPIDFLVSDGSEVLAVGLARYDGDRGGSQEDDRTGQYRDCAYEILTYANANGLRTKVIFLNNGPGLLLGSMWKDYAYIEDLYPGRVMVTTLRMLPERLTTEWLKS